MWTSVIGKACYRGWRGTEQTWASCFLPCICCICVRAPSLGCVCVQHVPLQASQWEIWDIRPILSGSWVPAIAQPLRRLFCLSCVNYLMTIFGLFPWIAKLTSCPHPLSNILFFSLLLTRTEARQACPVRMWCHITLLYSSFWSCVISTSNSAGL